MKRRTLFKGVSGALAAGLLTPLSALAQVADFKPFRQVSVPADKTRVFAFFSFACPVCREYHAPIARWGASLPSPLVFELVPVVTAEDRAHMIAARAWYAVQRGAPTRLPQFADAAYALVHERRVALDDPDLWRRAAQVAGIGDFVALWERASAGSVTAAVSRLREYAIAETPSLAIGGRYVITPDNTQGDARLFVELANGLTSQILRGVK